MALASTMASSTHPCVSAIYRLAATRLTLYYGRVIHSVVVKTFLKNSRPRPRPRVLGLETMTKTFAQNCTIKFHFKCNKCIHTHSSTFCCTVQCTSNSLQYTTLINVRFQLHANYCHCPTFTSRYSFFQHKSTSEVCCTWQRPGLRGPYVPDGPYVDA